MLTAGLQIKKHVSISFHYFFPRPYLALSDKVQDIWELETWMKNKTFITTDYFNGNLRENITEVLYIAAYKASVDILIQVLRTQPWSVCSY